MLTRDGAGSGASLSDGGADAHGARGVARAQRAARHADRTSGTFVQQRVGNVLDRRRDRIRAAAVLPAPALRADGAPGHEDISGSGGGVSAGTPSAPQHAITSGVHARGPVGLTPSGGSQLAPKSDATGPSMVGHMPAQPQQPASNAAKILLTIAVSVSVVAGLGAVGIVVMRNRATRDAAPPVTATAEAPKATATAPPKTTSSTTLAPSPSIELRGLPQEAVVEVDGKPLGPGARTVPRPAAGKKVSVVVSAAGFASQTLTLDESAPSSVEVALTIESPPQTVDIQRPAPPPSNPGPAASQKVALPANPY